MPPSANALYIKRGRGKGLALSGDARDYREHVKKIVQKNIMSVSRLVTDSSGMGPQIYGMDCTCYFQELENPAWFEKKVFSRGKRKGELKVKLRYKRVDVDNRLKFLQDALTKSMGIHDDSIIFEVTARKRQTSRSERVVVRLYHLDREGFLPPDPGG